MFIYSIISIQVEKLFVKTETGQMNFIYLIPKLSNLLEINLVLFTWLPTG